MPFTMAAVMCGNACRSLSAAMLGSTSLPTCAPACDPSTAKNARTPTIAATARCIAFLRCRTFGRKTGFHFSCKCSGLMSFTPSIADVRERVGETEQAHLHHHAGGQQGWRLGMQDLVQQLPRAQVRIELE